MSVDTSDARQDFMMAWIGSISLTDSTVLQDVRLSAPRNGPEPAIPPQASLRLLAFVETTRIPCHMVLGAPCQVMTSDDETERWFGQIFASSGDQDGSVWWESAIPDSPLGVLVGVEHHDVVSTDHAKEPRVTELLFYASRSDTAAGRLPTPPPSSPSRDGDSSAHRACLSIHAIPLSSDLLRAAEAAEPTPPLSPTSADEDVEAVFLPGSFSHASEIINEPPVRKRRSAADAFDEASERRRKARRRGGEGVIAAAAPKTESQLPSLKHHRSVSNTQPVPLQTRPLSRSPSVASSRPPTGVAQAAKKSSLSQVQSTVEANATETKNKDFLSRIVMAGMRLYGLSQSKSRGGKQKVESATASPAIDISFDDLEAERKNDEEFKLIYHQVYKGTCFAFRASIGVQALQPFAEQVRETVDRLLAIFCSDPLAEGLQSGGDEVTPGGRKAFGSRSVQEEKSPFLQVVGEGTEADTPSSRRGGRGGG